MPKVFVTQVPTKKDKATGARIPVVNIGPAAKYGEVITLMPPEAAFYATADMVRQLRAGLQGYDFDNGDCVIALGDPSIIIAVGAILAARTRKIRVLKWDRLAESYIPVEVSL